MLSALTVRRLLRLTWWVLAIAWLASLPWVVMEFKALQFSVHYSAWFIAGIFVLLALPVTVYEVAMQLEYFSRPKLQIRVIRILWMVPIYALDSWFALRFKDSRVYFDTIRECYEAYVIYNFFMYLLAYLEDEYGDIDAYFSTKEDVPHMWGFKYFVKPWRMGQPFFWECKMGVLAYVILRPLMTLVGFIASLLGVLGDGEFRFDRVYIYTAFINNFSQLWALYCLILFYSGTKDELAPIRPLSKFIVVKSVVFLSYWQGVLIAILVATGVIKSKDWRQYDVDDIASGLQEFLICIEMFFAAIAHAFAFPPRDYMDPNGQQPRGIIRNLRIMFDVRDVVDDVSGAVDHGVQRTTDNIMDAANSAWNTTKKQTQKALERPKKLLGIFSRQRRAGGEDDDFTEDDEEGGHTQNRPLMTYTAPPVPDVDGPR